MIVTFGEIMMRLKCDQNLRFSQNNYFEVLFGGSEINTSILLSLLGFSIKMVSALPDNPFGQKAIQQLQKYQIDTNHILKQGERIGLYFIENGNGIRQNQIIYDRKNSSFSEIKENDVDWNNILKNSKLFHWSGISISISENSKNCCINGIKTAFNNNIEISCDFNYRETLWYYGKKASDIMLPLVSMLNIIIADFDALTAYLNIKTNSKDKFENRFKNATKQLISFSPKMHSFAMTFREVNENGQYYYGALYYYGKFYFSKKHLLKNITDPIGTGDAFSGGLIYGILNKLEPQEIINIAVATGVLKQSIIGDFCLIDKSDIDYFLKNGITNKIKR